MSVTDPRTGPSGPAAARPRNGYGGNGVSPRRRGSLIGPLLLITAGCLLLLNNLGIVPWAVWGDLWRFWPVLLVLFGVELMLGGRFQGGLFGLALAVVVVLGLVALGVSQGSVFAGARPAATETRTFTERLQGASQLNALVQFGAGRLNVEALPPGSADTAATMTYSGPPEFQPNSSYRPRSGGVGDLSFSVGNHDAGFFGFPFFRGGNRSAPSMQVQLTRDVPISLRTQSGAADTTLDLTGLRVTNLELSTGASTTLLRLPEAAGTTTARIQGGASTITVEVPPGVAAQVTFQGGLSTLNVDQSRFPAVGDKQYRSLNYDTSSNKVDLRIEVGAATVTVR